MQSTPVVADGHPHVVTGWSNGYKGTDTRVVRVGDGNRLWTTRPRSQFLSILGHADDSLFIGTRDDAIGTSGESLFAVDSSGEMRWAGDTGDATEGVVDDETLYLDYGELQTVAIDTADGKERWTTDLGPPGHLAVYDDTMYLDRQTETLSGDYPLVAVNAGTGVERWSYAPDGTRFVATGAVEANETVYVTEYNGSLFALDAANGAEIWRYTAANKTSEPPTVCNELVYLPGDGELHAVDAGSGRAQWRESVPGHIWSALSSEAGVVLHERAESGQTTLRGLTPDGTEQWAHTFQAGTTRPVVDGLCVYVGTTSGYVVALGVHGG
jgi:outer membrane protein assembly factor BamB